MGVATLPCVVRQRERRRCVWLLKCVFVLPTPTLVCDAGVRHNLRADMFSFATLYGAGIGLGSVVYSNWLQKLPLYRRPWEHAIGITFGAYISNELEAWSVRTEKNIEEKL